MNGIAVSQRHGSLTDILVATLTETEWRRHAGAIMAIEAAAYEPARRASSQFLASLVGAPRAVTLIALENDQVVGFSFGAPLELFGYVRGVLTDPEWNRSTTLYSADLTVAPEWQGQGLGLRLKSAQLWRAHALGYRFIAGRNRVGLAEAMWRVNVRCGAYEVQRCRHAYGDGLEPDECIYYHIDLKRSLPNEASGWGGGE